MLVRLPIKQLILESFMDTVKKLNESPAEDPQKRANRMSPPDADTLHKQSLHAVGSNPDQHKNIHNLGMDNFKTGQKMDSKKLFEMKRTQGLYAQ